MDWFQVISEACPLITTGCPNSSACWVSIFDGVAPFGTDPAVVKKPRHIGFLGFNLHKVRVHHGRYEFELDTGNLGI
jgi:hypothetical protein